MEPFFNVHYADDPLPDDWVEAYQSPEVVEELSLPGVNPFVPTNFTLV